MYELHRLINFNNFLTSTSECVKFSWYKTLNMFSMIIFLLFIQAQAKILAEGEGEAIHGLYSSQ